jgi:surface antigen
MSPAHATTAELRQQVFARHRVASKKHRRGPKSTTIAAYTGVFLLIMSMVAIGYQPPQKIDSVANAASVNTNLAQPTDQPSVDQLVATNVAAGIAERADLPIANNVANLSLSLAAESELAQADNSLISKPQILQPSADGRTIKTYVTQAGDTVQKVSQQFGISAQTIKWANSLNSDALEPGRTLSIPPVDGVIYTVKAGDTVDSIAQKYNADKERLVAFNDLELGAPQVGKQIIIPGGDLPATERPGYVAPRGGGGSFNSSVAIGSFTQGSVGNRYARGNCTWWAYERRAQLQMPVGSFWGNASTWAAYASASGYAVDGNPAAGAVMANGGGYGGFGHVAVVEEVAVGQYVRVSEMNAYRGGGGFNRVSYFNVPWGEATSGMYRYIH